jgi:phage gp45-like
VVIGTNNQSLRPTGQNPGETTLFNAFSMSVALTESGIVISGGGKPVTVTNGDLHAGNIVATGTVAVTGEITVNGTTLAVP